MDRLRNQEVRLSQFNDETLPMHDIFDADLAHLRTMLENANLKLISLQAS
ncbi:GSCOCT00014194001.2-RA-CDS [Cotesia congregata]|nr:GSCOCT00014194001.2-RA-CDS [Cotesia congregata]CAG5084370.1 cc_bv3.4_31.13_pseudo [Cotesia congregata]CAG5110009.1 cc_bv3.4_31.13_pseudo [Cotesia congregata]